MRSACSIGAALLLVCAGAAGARASTCGEDAAAALSAACHCAPALAASPDRRAMHRHSAVAFGVGYRSAPADVASAYHDPRFSLQQDEIYDGRF